MSRRVIATGEKTKRKHVKPKKGKHFVMRDIDEEKQTAQDFSDLEEDERNRETTEEDQTGPERTRRNIKAPDRYGLPVYKCGVTKTK